MYSYDYILKFEKRHSHINLLNTKRKKKKQKQRKKVKTFVNKVRVSPYGGILQ